MFSASDLFRFILLAMVAVPGFATHIVGTVHDSSGAVIVQATIEISGASLVAPVSVQSDAQGHFESPDLAPGVYTIQVAQRGFTAASQTVALADKPISLEIKLAVAPVREEVTVTGNTAAKFNADPFYQQLRRIGLSKSVMIENARLVVDVGTLELKKGTLTWFNRVDRQFTGAVFIGDAVFSLHPVSHFDAEQLAKQTGDENFSEPVTHIVFRFTNGGGNGLIQLPGDEVPTPAAAQSILSEWQEKVRARREIPLSFTESILHGDQMDNVDADVLACIYNPKHPGFFNAYMRGRKHKDLRFFYRPRTGAIPQIDSPEEVALINYAPESLDDGIYYLTHTREERAYGHPTSGEERRLFAPSRFTIETVIGNNDHLTAVASVDLTSLLEGERLVKFGLLPNLRVTRVADEKGGELAFVQESRKTDGSFYVILNQPLAKGATTTVKIEYSGDKVVYQAGEGSFYVRARESWYPNPNSNGFGNRALFDLTFKVPKKYHVISVGNLEREWTEDKYSVSHWVTPSPVAVAGFNYGSYKKLELTDDKTGSTIDGFYLPELPYNLRGFASGALTGMAPGGMTKHVMDETRSQLQVCNYFFGKSGFDRIYITEQPDFNFGQSWPNLVYLPISAYMDSTQRWRLLGQISDDLTAFVNEVTPHEVAHQWWGHAVGWSSYHDQWLSEGFAEFSAALFVQTAEGPGGEKDYIQMWDRLRKRLLDKTEFGTSPNDAGPLWLGLRLISPRTQSAYRNVTYPKGAFVLAMLRQLLYTQTGGDKDFIAMMHDFVETHRDHPASTESFQAIVEKHIPKSLDLTRDGKMDWFFKEWVYGTQIPKYSLKYQVTPTPDGKFKLHMTVAQSGVDNTFLMPVPIYVDLGKGKGLVKLGQMPIQGSTSQSADVLLPVEPKNVVANAYHDILERP